MSLRMHTGKRLWFDPHATVLRDALLLSKATFEDGNGKSYED